MEEEIFISIMTEELEILRALKNRLFDVPYRLEEDDTRGELITKEAKKISAICDALQRLLDATSA